MSLQLVHNHQPFSDVCSPLSPSQGPLLARRRPCPRPQVRSSLSTFRGDSSHHPRPPPIAPASKKRSAAHLDSDQPPSGPSNKAQKRPSPFPPCPPVTNPFAQSFPSSPSQALPPPIPARHSAGSPPPSVQSAPVFMASTECPRASLRSPLLTSTAASSSPPSPRRARPQSSSGGANPCPTNSGRSTKTGTYPLLLIPYSLPTLTASMLFSATPSSSSPIKRSAQLL